MMRFFKRIYRENFWPHSKRLLIELLEAEPTTIAGIVLQEIGLPYGGVTTCRWWKTSQSGFFSRVHRVVGESEHREEVEATIEQFDHVYSLIDKMDSIPFKSFSGNLRDGGNYAIAWGTAKRLRYFGMSNWIPVPGSRYGDLIQVLKENVWA